MPAKPAANIHQPAQAYWGAVDTGSDSKAPLDTSLGLCMPSVGNSFKSAQHAWRIANGPVYSYSVA